MKYRLPAGLSGLLLIRHLLMLISVAERRAPTPLPHLCTVVVSKTRRPFLMVLDCFGLGLECLLLSLENELVNILTIY